MELDLVQVALQRGGFSLIVVEVIILARGSMNRRRRLLLHLHLHRCYHIATCCSPLDVLRLRNILLRIADRTCRECSS